MIKKSGVVGVLSLGAMVLAMQPAVAGGIEEIVAAKVKADPASIDDAAWGKAQEITISMDGVGDFEGKKEDIKVKAVYTKNGNISFLLTWNDPTKSMDGKAWVKDGDAWKQKDGDMDRVAFNFETRRIKNFANKGCTVLCHAESKNPKEWKYHTEKAPQFGDLWVWESYRSDPMGKAGDYFVDDDSRKADKGTGKASKNMNKFGDGPVYMQDPAKQPSLPGFLMDEEKAKIGDADVAETPVYMLNKFSGDFADITTQSKHDGSKWTVMMQRKLSTGSDTDVEFKTKKQYSLGIAVFENSGMYNKYASPPLKLKFK
jgi:hypothetical protein